MVVLFIFFFLHSAYLICPGTDNSKYFKESLGLGDNKNQLYSFFIGSVIKRNHLPDSIVHADTVEGFRAALHSITSFHALSTRV